MEQLDLIRMTHEIDKSLARIAEAISDERLKKDVATIHTQWRELGYQVTAALCGVSPGTVLRTTGRRGRPRKVQVTDGTQPFSGSES